MSASTTKGQHNAEVLEAMEDYIVTNGRLPSTPDLVRATDLSDHYVGEALDRLEANGDVKAAFRRSGQPTVWVPSFMWEALLHYKKTPSWLDEYALERRLEIERNIRDEREELDQLRRIEDLLHTSGQTLEEAVHAAFEILEVDDLAAGYEDGDSWDHSFGLDGQVFVVEDKGKTRAASKGDVNQLKDWVEQYSEQNESVDPDALCGLLVINHFKDEMPDDRWPDNPDRPPITTHAERSLRLRDRTWFVTTVDLFKLAAGVLDETLSKAEAREELRNQMRRSVSDDE